MGVHSELFESTFDIDRDVDFIYNKFFNKFVYDFKNNKVTLDNYQSYGKQDAGYEEVAAVPIINYILFGKIKSDKLISSDCKKANKINPIVIYCLLTENGNYYQDAHEPFFISIAIDYGIAISLLYKKDKELGVSQLKLYKNEITVTKVKSSIYHELSHWLRDSFHGGFLTSLVDLASWLENKDILKLKQKSVNMAYFEIDAQIHGIKNVKRQVSLIKQDWNTLSFDALLYRYNALYYIAKELYSDYGVEVLEIWEKYLLKRMARENLLGKSMNHFIDIKHLKERIYRIY